MSYKTIKRKEREKGEMIPPYFLTERLRLRFFKSIGTLFFCINYLIISLLEESKLENLPDSKSSN